MQQKEKIRLSLAASIAIAATVGIGYTGCSVKIGKFGPVSHVEKNVVGKYEERESLDIAKKDGIK